MLPASHFTNILYLLDARQLETKAALEGLQ